MGRTNGFERFREYLRVLAELQVDRPLARKIHPSDIVQETLLEAHRDREQLRGQTDAECAAWLRKILSNVVLQAARTLRTQKRDIAREISLDDLMARSSLQLEACLAAAGVSPSSVALREERLFEVASALGRLPDEQREVIILHHCNGLTLKDIGDDLGRTRASVAGLLRRGLKELRSHLGADEAR